VTNVLWPLYKQAQRHVGDSVWTEKRILLLNNYTVDDRGTFINVWPFFEYRESGENLTFFFPSILPFRNKGFDRIMRPLITLFELHKKEDSVATSFLYGFYTKEQKGDSWRRRLAFLVEVRKEPDGTGFQFLSGLFGMDSKTVKVLFIPFARSKPFPDVCPE
jgi:hypothetical protein